MTSPKSEYGAIWDENLGFDDSFVLWVPNNKEAQYQFMIKLKDHYFRLIRGDQDIQDVMRHKILMDGGFYQLKCTRFSHDTGNLVVGIYQAHKYHIFFLNHHATFAMRSDQPWIDIFANEKGEPTMCFRANKTLADKDAGTIELTFTEDMKCNISRMPTEVVGLKWVE
jgi:hypothetical protein